MPTVGVALAVPEPWPASSRTPDLRRSHHRHDDPHPRHAGAAAEIGEPDLPRSSASRRSRPSRTRSSCTCGGSARSRRSRRSCS